MLKKGMLLVLALLVITRNRWYESILLAGVTFALLRPYYVAQMLLAAESKFLYIAIAAVAVYGLIFLLQRLRAPQAAASTP